MKNASRRLPTASLFAQLLALVVVSLLGASVINLLITFSLPPPTPDFYRIGEVAQVIKGQPLTALGQRRPLVALVSDKPPTITSWQLGSNVVPAPPASIAELASGAGVDASRVLIVSEQGRYADRRAFRLVRDELARNGHTTPEHVLFSPFKVGVLRADGRWLIVEPQPSLHFSQWQMSTMLWFFLTTILLSPIAYLFARRMARPIALFAQAAERFGRDPRSPPLAVSGPSEIAVAVRAFNDMQERLARYVEDRTAMVGAIAHDLRTPLTRLRFRLEAAPEDVRIKMASDIAEMEAMISGTLAFVRDATRPAERTRLELSSLLESLSDEMSETGQDVEVERAERVVVDGDPVALRRLFNNLLDNAIKFGLQARVRVYPSARFAVVEIDDRGKGLPETALEKVFEPFYRAEGSRSRETGGIGLGLAVVRSIARAHGGDATLSNREGGGMTARVLLPL